MDSQTRSGWSQEFTCTSERLENPPDESRNEPEVELKVPSGLHCGPAGRRTLIKWLEDNYKLRRGMHNTNPGVLACRLWQESQGFSDQVSRAIVGLLKLQGIPANVTYQTVFENYLAKQLSTLIKRGPHSQDKSIDCVDGSSCSVDSLSDCELVVREDEWNEKNEWRKYLIQM
ncbi:conserved hypothetical protein [Theileria equi strain WA]|uniref:Uncharacterized protein n=1 Tax=Theileria equi strain WA TaxID=1537102 RepID=L1LF73_THEEQ|nr:conserved hypothetical protein [Theileria equi strain WA]EKX73934.1 conserved hypothetical protein [Theileria equi strain WA]|eukprot:XP_004833386.1 conserved hypothetical protein [Theileria equi strain WA]